jgi:CelD/BcsL family acetyltransferase involved in cellulose biosynthesis
MPDPPNEFANWIQPDQWIPRMENLVFEVGGVRLAQARFRSLSLAVPFNKLVKDLLIVPPQQEFPAGIDVMVVSAQPIEKDLPRVAILSNFIRYVTVQENRYYLEFCGSFSDYLKKLSSNTRRNLGRAVRKFAEFSGGEICWQEFRSGQEMLEFYRLAREVSKRTYQEELHLGLPDSDELRLTMVEQASRGLLRGYLLFHKGKPVAYSYNPIQQENVFSKWLGYDPEFRQWAPGTVLLYLMLEKLFGEKRFALFDLGQTEFDYKAFFSTGYTRCARLLYFPRNSYNLALVAAHNALNRISVSSGKVLKILRLKTAAGEFLGRLMSAPYLRHRHRNPQ